MRIIAYYRVSTRRQGDSGLGLEAQAAAVRAHAERTGSTILQEFTEVESGRNNRRPQLAQAVAATNLSRSTLVVAKLDRLARDAKFILQLVDSGCTVRFLDLPDMASDPVVGRMVLTILAAVAEMEAKRISERVSAALAAYKARGGKLGAHDSRCKGFRINPAGSLKGNWFAVRACKLQAVQFRAKLMPVLESIVEQVGTLAAAVEELNRLGYRTRRGKPWTVANLWAIINWKNKPPKGAAAGEEPPK